MLDGGDHGVTGAGGLFVRRLGEKVRGGEGEGGDGGSKAKNVHVRDCSCAGRTGAGVSVGCPKHSVKAACVVERTALLPGGSGMRRDGQGPMAQRKVNGFVGGTVLGDSSPDFRGNERGGGSALHDTVLFGDGERLMAQDGAAGRDAEFAALVERQSRMMFRVAYSLLRNTHDAEDSVQEALLKLYRSESWLRMENERAFLAKTVWRVALDRAMAAKAFEDVDATGLATREGSPELLAAGMDERMLLREMIDRLPEDLRRPLVLSAIEEMTSGEVAVILGIPEGTVRTRVMRAKAELKKRFEAMKEVQR